MLRALVVTVVLLASFDLVMLGGRHTSATVQMTSSLLRHFR
jgi:hypothetical protein